MDTIIDIFLGFNFVVSIVFCGVNFWYFLSAKNIWRWIKLAYSVNLFLFGVMLLYQSRCSISVNPIEIVLHSLLLYTIASGTIVSIAKLRVIRHFNGDTNGTNRSVNSN